MEHFDKKNGLARILETWKKYVDSKGEHPEHIEYIQHIVDRVGEPFILVIPAKKKKFFKDVPHRVIFTPKGLKKRKSGIIIPSSPRATP